MRGLLFRVCLKHPSPNPNSVSGGLDFPAAAKLGIKAIWALSLPGEVAPVTSGAIIRDTIYNILREKGMAP
jgi:dipicolinate synthase subunit A